MRLFYLNVMIAVAAVVHAVVEAVRNRSAFYRDLGLGFYVRGFYSPESVGLGIQFQYAARDDFELAVDFGPFTVAAGRDFVI